MFNVQYNSTSEIFSYGHQNDNRKVLMSLYTCVYEMVARTTFTLDKVTIEVTSSQQI